MEQREKTIYLIEVSVSVPKEHSKTVVCETSSEASRYLMQYGVGLRDFEIIDSSSVGYAKDFVRIKVTETHFWRPS